MQSKELTIRGKILLQGSAEENEETLANIADALNTLMKIQLVKDNGNETVTYLPFSSVQLVEDELTLCVNENEKFESKSFAIKEVAMFFALLSLPSFAGTLILWMKDLPWGIGFAVGSLMIIMALALAAIDKMPSK